MSSQRSPKQLAKFLNYVLGRRPNEFGLVTDKEGFVKIKELIKAINEEEGLKYVRRPHINEIMITLPNHGLEVANDLIRAINRGHLPKQTFALDPPKLLYTCVRKKAYPYVLDKGIMPTGFSKVILSSNRDLADDIVQNACLKAWKARKSFDPKRGKFRAWMFTITRNEFLQLMRKQRPVDYYDPAAFESKLVQQCQLDSRSACSDAIQALFKLSDEQRDVFILVLAAGYSYEEAAAICNCSVGTVKSRINRARAKLTELGAAHEAGAAQSADQPIRFRGLEDIFGRVEALLKRAA